MPVTTAVPLLPWLVTLTVRDEPAVSSSETPKEVSAEEEPSLTDIVTSGLTGASLTAVTVIVIVAWVLKKSPVDSFAFTTIASDVVSPPLCV